MIYTSPKLLTFEAFIEQYGDNPRYELIDGELRDMEPTGPHEAVAGSLAGRIYAEILRLNLNWLIPKNCLIKPPVAEATVRSPIGVGWVDAGNPTPYYSLPTQPSNSIGLSAPQSVV